MYSPCGSECGGAAEQGKNRMALGIELLLCEAQVVVALEVLPELRARPEVDAETDGGVRRDGALAADDAIHAGRRDVQVERQAVLADPHRVEELLLEDFPGMNQILRDMPDDMRNRYTKDNLAQLLETIK